MECFQVLHNSLGNIKKNVWDLHKMLELKQDSQIKPEFRQNELNNNVNFISKKCDQYGNKGTESKIIWYRKQFHGCQMNKKL